MNTPRRSRSFLTVAALFGALSLSALHAQEPVSPAPPAPPAIEAAPAAEAAPAKDAKDKHRLKIEIGGSSLDPALRDKLSTDQLMQLELAKRQRGSAWSDMEDIVIPLAFFIMIFGIVAVTVSLRLRQRRLMHETIRLMVEKGQPVPPELFTPSAKPRSSLGRALTSIGLGIGLILCALGIERSLWGIGCIPLFLGLGQLLAWKLERPKPGANPPTA